MAEFEAESQDYLVQSDRYSGNCRCCTVTQTPWNNKVIHVAKNTSNSDTAGFALMTAGPDAMTSANELGEALVTAVDSPDKIEIYIVRRI